MPTYDVDVKVDVYGYGYVPMQVEAEDEHDACDVALGENFSLAEIEDVQLEGVQDRTVESVQVAT